MRADHYSHGKCIAPQSTERRVIVVRKYRSKLRAEFKAQVDKDIKSLLDAGCNITDVIGQTIRWEEARVEKGHFEVMKELNEMLRKVENE